MVGMFRDAGAYSQRVAHPLSRGRGGLGRRKGLRARLSRRLGYDKAAGAAAEAVIQRWNDQLALGRDMLWSLTIRAVVLAGTVVGSAELFPPCRIA